MTDKEFKRLSRAQLVEIIYQLQLQTESLTEQNRELEKALADKRLRINNTGTLAEAALEINNCFKSAQEAADQYLSEIKVIREETEKERQWIIAEAQAEAESIIANAKKICGDTDADAEALMKKINRSHSDNG